MSHSLDDIQGAAHLSRLIIDEKKAKQLAPQFKDIWALVNEINSVNTDGVDPLAHPLGFSQPLRKDEVTETNQREAFQKLTSHIEEGLYIVPKIIEDE